MSGGFFKQTAVAGRALAAEFTFKPYYNLHFQLNAFILFLAHLIRLTYNLLRASYHFLAAFSFALIPTAAWMFLPLMLGPLVGGLLGTAINVLAILVPIILFKFLVESLVEFIDDILATAISAITVTLAMPLLGIRTLTSMVFGYQNAGSSYDDDSDDDFDDARTIFALAS